MFPFLHRLRTQLGVSVIASALGCASLSGQAPALTLDVRKAIEPMRSIITEHVATHDQAGVSITLVDGNGTIWSEQFGLADRPSQSPVTAQTIFELGSISKVFTCMAVMQLQEQGKLEIDKPFALYIPEFSVKSHFPNGGEAITLRMLMTHQSGLVTDDDPWETAHPERYFHRAVLEHVKGTELLFPPGQRWNYSSFGVSLLGLLVERLSGQDYSAYMRKNILDPLEMPSASFDFRDLDLARVASSYHYNPAYEQIPKDEIRPAGSLRAPLGEAAHLLSLVLQRGTFQGRNILSPQSIEEMTRLQRGDQSNPMGLGFRIRQQGLGGSQRVQYLYHDGVARNRSAFVLVPAWKAGFIISVNDHQGADTLVWELKEGFLTALAGM